MIFLLQEHCHHCCFVSLYVLGLRFHAFALQLLISNTPRLFNLRTDGFSFSSLQQKTGKTLSWFLLLSYLKRAESHGFAHITWSEAKTQ